MLPKVATQILHTTTRAAAAVHNQTSTLRNVLQLQTTPSPSAAAGTAPLTPWNGTGSSSWGNHGPGPGGTKQNSGSSRFYTGFTGPVRAVTQANAVTSQDGTFVQHEEQEETASVPTRRAALRTPKEARLRSSSTSIGAMGRQEQPENLGVLKTVQIHARSRHAFSQGPARVIDSSTSSSTALSKKKLTIQRSRPLIARRNSTSSPTSVTVSLPGIPTRRKSTYAAVPDSSSDIWSVPPPPPPRVSTAGLHSTDPAAPQTSQPPRRPSTPSARPPPQDTAAYLALKAACDTKQALAVADAVRHFRQTTENPTVREFNMALEGLVKTRPVGEPLTLVLETYNDMLRLSLIPTIQTYILLIQALTARDFEIHRVIWGIRRNLQRRTSITGDLERGDWSSEEERLAVLQQENHFASALDLFEKVISVNGNSLLPAETYDSLLRACGYHGDAAQATHVFALLEGRNNVKPSSMAYKYLIQAYTNTGKIDAAEQVFAEYREICNSAPEKLSWGSDRATTYDQKRVLAVWNQMIDAYFKAGMPDKAIGLVENMMASPGIDVPSPSSSTFTAVLAGFCDSGEVQTALVWFSRLLEQQHGPGQDPLLPSSDVVRPDGAAWNLMIEALASHGMVEELNTLFGRMLTDGAKDGMAPTKTQRVITTAANMKAISNLGEPDAQKALEFILANVIPLGDKSVRQSGMVRRVWEECFARGFVVSLLHDMEARGISIKDLEKDFVDRVRKVLSSKYDAEALKEIVSKLGPELRTYMEQAEVQSPTSTLVEESGSNISSSASSPTLYNPTAEHSPVTSSPAPKKIFVDTRLSRDIDEFLKNAKSLKEAAEGAYRRLIDSYSQSRLPNPITVGRIIQALGRSGEIDKVKDAYGFAHTALRAGAKFWNSDAWFRIEDAMVIALAHAGQIEAAHEHRKMILSNQGAPTADAYGVLILCMKDTTDDTSNALSLFQEAVDLNVTPNQYLYNNIISKLAKARKAEHALDLFNRMKAQSIYPSSITYGAVIGACARVGDVQSAETLFTEMESAKNFKPRVPPYNTMMQLYTTTKPNRERALHYYLKMKEACVQPTAHTYKLLMDTYGALEPVDVQSMEQVFRTLQEDHSVPIQGTHFASLINAYGCVVKDLAKAVSVFDSIPTYYPRAQPADAVVYEAMINVLVALKRADLIEEYIAKMTEQGVKMTAYIANFLIKGYANARQLDQARAIFEGLADPPEGVAAPGNHVPHDGAASPTTPGQWQGAVYREPSTWEAMIRAELGAGEKARAMELLDRLRARKYPDAVFNRISGILVDHSIVL